MHDGGFFFQAFIYLAAAVIAVPVAKRLGLGSVLGYLIAGILIGPFVFGLIGREGEGVMHVAEFGVIIMLFLVGLEVQPSMIWRLRGPIFGLGGLQVGLTALAFTVIGIVLGLPWQTSLAIGLIFSMSSTAIALQTLKEKGLLQTSGGQNAFSVLLFQDIAVIPILAFMPLLSVADNHDTGHAHDSHHATVLIEKLPLWGQTLAVLGVVAAIIFAGKYLVGPCLRWIANTRLRELFIAAGLLLIIGIALLMPQVGLSPALGTFLAGVVLAQSEFRHELESDIDPFKGLLLGLFFIAVGASIDFNLIFREPIMIIGLVALLIVVKLLVLLSIGKAFRLSQDHNRLFSFSLAQGGEFAFVLFSFATQNQVFSSEIANPLIAVVALSMALTPLLMMVNEKLIQPRFGTRESVDTGADAIEESNKVIIAGFGRVGSVIGRFLQAHGVQSTYLDIDADHVDLSRRLGFKVYYGDASRADLLETAGAGEARLLVIAVDDIEKCRQIIDTVQRHYPDLPIYARTEGIMDSLHCIDVGVAGVYRETIDTALRMGSDILRLCGHRAYQTRRSAKAFYQRDEMIMRELMHYKDRKQRIATARELMHELEEFLLAERDAFGKDKDSGWDTESLKEDFKDN